MQGGFGGEQKGEESAKPVKRKKEKDCRSFFRFVINRARECFNQPVVTIGAFEFVRNQFFNNSLDLIKILN